MLNMYIPFVLVMLLIALVWPNLVDGFFDIAKDTPLKWWNPLVWPVAIIALVMYPFVRISERKLPKNQRTPLF